MSHSPGWSPSSSCCSSPGMPDPVNLVEARWRLRSRLEAREITFGGWCGIPSGMSAELMGVAGFDWLCVDMQHGLVGYESMVCMLRATDIHRVPVLVRVSRND